MVVYHVQSGRKVRLSSSHKLFGNERETLNEAFPGDIIGLVGHDGFGIGDTLTSEPSIRFDEIPRFTPEVFEFFHNPNTAKFKQVRQGLEQLLLEGVAQAFHLKDTASRVPLLAAVGPLQFEVLQYRLETEYGAETRREPAPFAAVRWLPEGFQADSLESLSLPTGGRFAFDIDQNPVALFPTEWALNYFSQNNPSLTLSPLAPKRR
jgi:peptide chain release factor 3